MKMRTGFCLAVFAAAILLLLPIAPAALAQDYGQDPPTRAGRIGYVQGSVSFQPSGQGDWLEAVPNRPLTTGDNLWVDKDGRAEVQIGSTSIRLGPETSLTLLELGNDVTQLRLSMGSLFFRVRHFGGDDTFEVDAANLAFNVNQPGEFRLDVNGNGDQTSATVWRGEAEITGGGNSYRLQAGQQGTFSGTDQLNYDVAEISSPDDFGRWAMSRDEREDRVRSREYVSDEMTGYEDLDDYGRWHEVSGYGNVWTPGGVPGDWAPYRYGHWVFVSPWGWTWVEQEPWGFAPFHYGRWAFVDSGWCWIPGPVAVRPVYSPALVAFVGGGGFHGGIGIGGGVGWFPLGPGEVFVPWYRTSPRYVQNVNITNTHVNVVQVTNVYNNVTVNHVTNVTYVNQRVNNSVTVVNHDTFVNARPVHDNIVRVDQRQIESAQVSHETVSNIRPARESVLGAGRPVQMKPPEQVMNREVVATRQPTVVNRPPAAQGVERTAAPPPAVKMIRSAPATEAQPLQRGQSGSSQGMSAPAPSPRPGAPNIPAENNNNRGGVPRPGEAGPQPGAQGNNPRQGEMAPRPGNPENGRNGNQQPNGNAQPGMTPPPPTPQNGRGAAPDNNRPLQQVPRPPSAMKPQEQAPPPRHPDSARPENGRPNNAPPETARPPEQTVRPNNSRPDMQPPPNSRPAPPRPETHRPEPPARPPETRPQPTPQPEVQREPAPRPTPQTEPAHAQPRERTAPQPTPQPEVP